MTEPQPGRPLLSRTAWLWILSLGFLFILLFSKYFDRLLRIVTETRGGDFSQVLQRLVTLQLNSDWAHVLIIPLFSFYYIHLHKDQIARTQRQVFWLGLPIMLAGILSFIFWVFPGRNDMFQGLSMVLSLFGLVLFLLGPRMMTWLWFPICYLVFSVKISDMLWDRISWKLQLIAAQSSAIVLNLLGLVLNMEASVRGSTIDMWSDGRLIATPLNVAEACSGLRMLMAFIALGVAIAFIAERPWWQRVVMVLASVPIAVAVNVGRVTVLGVLYAKVDPKWASGDVHILIGMLMLIPAAGLCWLLGWILDHIMIAEEPASRTRKVLDPANPPHPAAPAPGGRVGIRSMGLGVAMGLGLGLCAGLSYMLTWGLYKPDVLFGSWLSSRGAVALLFFSLLALAGMIFSSTRLTKPESRPQAGTPVRAMALAVGLMLASLVGLSTMVNAAQVVLIKQPLELRAKLSHLPLEVGTWKMARDAGALPEDVVKTLGTESYISRQYMDTSWPAGKEGSVVTLHVAYYTGTPDTVPHVPDRCFVANGIRPVGTRDTVLQLAGPQFHLEADGLVVADSQLARKLGIPVPHIPVQQVPATVFTFGDPRQPQAVSNVIYFFAANGRYLNSPNAVRKQGLDPRDRYSYHCKIEVQVDLVADPALAAERVSEFLSQMLPEIMTCLPDWVLVNRNEGLPYAGPPSSGP